MGEPIAPVGQLGLDYKLESEEAFAELGEGAERKPRTW
jgi:hypothetical protein